MPDLDVSDILLDPDFCELLMVVRQAVAMVKGRPVITPTTISPAPVGVVLPLPDSPLIRGPDQQNLPRMIEVHTPFRLQGPVPGFQPDIVVWNGNNYLVTRLYDFSRFGSGFVSAECSSVDSVDQAPTP